MVRLILEQHLQLTCVTRSGMVLIISIRHQLMHIKFQIAIDKAKSLGKNVTSQFFLPSSTSNFEAFRELEKIDGHFKSMKLTKKEWNKPMALYES